MYLSRRSILKYFNFAAISAVGTMLVNPVEAVLVADRKLAFSGLEEFDYADWRNLLNTSFIVTNSDLVPDTEMVTDVENITTTMELKEVIIPGFKDPNVYLQPLENNFYLHQYQLIFQGQDGFLLKGQLYNFENSNLGQGKLFLVPLKTKNASDRFYVASITKFKKTPMAVD